MAANSLFIWFGMEFPERLTSLRKERGMTQQALADSIGMHVLQIRRYEAGSSQPTLDVIRRLAIALGVSADMLVFEKDARGPNDRLRYQFETISRMSEREQEVIRELLDAMIVKNQVSGTIARVTLATEKSKEGD
ncbi:helix-turn-helix domain-containing protein [Erwinia pyrifoliae]|nr:helix-turn-helix domain-containing protein [Erwinia pyrifoliae]MCT2387991.1 helix-turn-helix domain-containing protein [Erwinia pyrifoliae]UXK12751.1 helix-turn-helix domain-containing protein [Erwinia pyrifoliae]UXK12759.1 helix-turn-helix domain-containing protein [Erwinia pyrifoliae]